jgi:hypothetical protein
VTAPTGDSTYGRLDGGNHPFIALTTKKLGNIRFASQFPGGDAGAKINAADADLGAIAGEIWVDQSIGSWSTQVTLNANHVLRFVQGGTYSATTGSLINIAGNNACVVGDERDITVLSTNQASGVMITVASAISGVVVRDIQLTRTVTASAQADGIQFGLTGSGVGQSQIRNIHIRKQDRGLVLGPTDYSVVENVISEQNQSQGFLLLNSSSSGQCQWSLKHCFAQMNGAEGFKILASSGPGSFTVGSYDDIGTFGNTGRGIAFYGLVGVPIGGIRIANSFFRADADSEIYLDTNGSLHRIQNTYTEAAGGSATGPTLSTPASNTGHGVEITANNNVVLLSGVYVNGNSRSGVSSSATHLVANGVVATNNGASATAGAATQSGIYIGAGTTATITGGKSGNTAGTSQKNGIGTAADILNVSGINLTNNATAAVASSVTLTNSVIAASTPAAPQNVGLINVSGAVPNSNFTTSSTTYVDVTGASATITTTGGDVQIWFSGPGHSATQEAQFTINNNGSDCSQLAVLTAGGQTNLPVSLVYRLAALTAGTYTLKLRAKVTSGGTLTMNFGSSAVGAFVVAELKH